MKKKSVLARDVMIERVELLAPDAEVHDAVRILLKRGYGALPGESAARARRSSSRTT